MEANFWMNATPAIHGHGFSGAFYVLDGSSIHTKYTFTESHRENDYLRAGELDRTILEILKPGDTRSIRNGRKGIHSLFHLVRPSVTLVIRSHIDHQSLPQFTYAPPSLEFFRGFGSVVQRKKLPLVRAMFSSSHNEAIDRLRAHLRCNDCLLETFELLTYLCLEGLLTTDLTLELVTDCLTERAPVMVTPFLAGVWEGLRQATLTRMRKATENFEAQLFLSLLAVADNRNEIADMMGVEVSSRLELLVVDAIKQLFGVANGFVTLNGFEDAETLDAAPRPARVVCPPLFLVAALRGTSPQALARQLQELGHGSEFSVATVREILHTIRSLNILRPLFADLDGATLEGE